MTVVTFYNVTYFNYFNKRGLFGVLNAVIILGGGLTSSLVSGKICDKYESTNPRIKSYVPTVMSIIAAPLFMFLYLEHSSFGLSCFIFFLENLLCEGWMAPSIAMI